MVQQRVSRVVYGVVDATGSAEFLPADDASFHARLSHACERARTWAEFRTLAPDGVWDDAMRRIGGIREAGGEAELPRDDDPFDLCLVPGACEGDWFWPTAMSSWMPQDVMERFGKWSGSPVSGDHWLFIAPDAVERVAEALRARGVVCVRDDALVGAAWGYLGEDSSS